MALRLTKIDELSRPDHSYLSEADECYFIGEYTARAGYAKSATNDLIFNLKKSPLKRGRPEWPWKAWAIQQAAEQLRGALNPDWIREATMVPVPPSKALGHPEYDDRMVQVARLVEPSLDVRELVRQRETLPAAHESSHRLRPEELAAHYEIVEELAVPTPISIGVLDDVLTTGSHLIAMTQVLSVRFPGIPIFGLFVARRVPTNE